MKKLVGAGITKGSGATQNVLKGPPGILLGLTLVIFFVAAVYSSFTDPVIVAPEQSRNIPATRSVG